MLRSTAFPAKLMNVAAASTPITYTFRLPACCVGLTIDT